MSSIILINILTFFIVCIILGLPLEPFPKRIDRIDYSLSESNVRHNTLICPLPKQPLTYPQRFGRFTWSHCQTRCLWLSFHRCFSIFTSNHNLFTVLTFIRFIHSDCQQRPFLLLPPLFTFRRRQLRGLPPPMNPEFVTV